MVSIKLDKRGIWGARESKNKPVGEMCKMMALKKRFRVLSLKGRESHWYPQKQAKELHS